jgi:hypothetical protein
MATMRKNMRLLVEGAENPKLGSMNSWLAGNSVMNWLLLRPILGISQLPL